LLIVDSHVQVIFRYSLVTVIETDLFQKKYMNNIAHILFVGIFFWF